MAGNGGGNGNSGGVGAGSGNGSGALGIPGLSFSTLSRVPTAPSPRPATPAQTSSRPSGFWGEIFDAAQSIKGGAGQGAQPTARPAQQPAQYRTVPEATTGALGIPGLNFAPMSDAQYQAQYGHIGRQDPAPAPVAPTPQPTIEDRKAAYRKERMENEHKYWGSHR